MGAEGWVRVVVALDISVPVYEDKEGACARLTAASGLRTR